MKYVIFIISFFLVVAVIAQNDCPAAAKRMLKEAEAARTAKSYEKAIDKCNAARNCNSVLANEADALIVKIFKDIEGEKKMAVENEKRALESEGRAKNQTILTQKAQQETEQQRLIALEERDKAVDEANAANNIALAYQCQRSGNILLARRINELNYRLHPQNSAVIGQLRSTENDSLFDFPIKDIITGVSAIDGIAISPNQREIAVCGANGYIEIWNFRGDCKTHIRIFEQLAHFVDYLNDTMLLVGAYQGLKVLNTQDGKCSDFFNVKRNRDDLTIFKISPNKKTIAFVDKQARLICFNIHTQKYDTLTKALKTPDIFLSFSPNSEKLAVSCAHDSVIYLFDMLKKTKTKLIGHKMGCTSINYALDGEFIVSSGGDNKIIIWDTKTNTIFRTIPIATYFTNFLDKHTIINTVNNKIFLINFIDNTIIQKLVGHTNENIKVVYSDINNALISCSDDGSVKIWDYQKHMVTISPYSDESKFITLSNNDTLLLWDSIGHRVITRVKEAKLSFNGQKIAYTLEEKPYILVIENINTQIKDTIRLKEGIIDFSFFKEADKLAYISSKGKLIYYDFLTHKDSVLWNNPDNPAQHLYWLEKEDYIITCLKSYTAQIWSKTGRKVNFLDYERLVFTKDKKGIYFLNYSNIPNNYKICNIYGDTTFTLTTTKDIMKVSLSIINDKFIINTLPQGEYEIWDMYDKNSHYYFPNAYSIAISKDSKNIVIGMENGEVAFYTYPFDKPTFSEGIQKQPISDLRYSPNEKMVFVGNSEKWIQILDNKGKLLKYISIYIGNAHFLFLNLSPYSSSGGALWNIKNLQTYYEYPLHELIANGLRVSNNELLSLKEDNDIDLIQCLFYLAQDSANHKRVLEIINMRLKQDIKIDENDELLSIKAYIYIQMENYSQAKQILMPFYQTMVDLKKITSQTHLRMIIYYVLCLVKQQSNEDINIIITNIHLEKFSSPFVIYQQNNFDRAKTNLILTKPIDLLLHYLSPEEKQKYGITDKP